jgi:hypothetical protein
MPDPEDIYSTILGNADVSNSTVHIPNIRDGNGDIITPAEYEKRLVDGSIVMINVYLKLYVKPKNKQKVILGEILNTNLFYRWILRPVTRGNGNYRFKDGDENGTRVYQVILNSMQLLPVNDIFTIINAPINIPEKRKPEANSEFISKSNKKKPAATMKTTNKKNTRRTVAQTDSSLASGSKTQMEIDTA